MCCNFYNAAILNDFHCVTAIPPPLPCDVRFFWWLMFDCRITPRRLAAALIWSFRGRSQTAVRCRFEFFNDFLTTFKCDLCLIEFNLIMLTSVIIVACLAVLAAVFYQSETAITGDKIILGTEGYDMIPLAAPAATSTMLDALSYILTKSIFGHSLRRMLLNDNRIALVRELSAQINLPPLFYPMKRLKKSQLVDAETEKAQQAELDAVLAHGFDEVVNTDGTSRTIQDYANYYKQG